MIYLYEGSGAKGYDVIDMPSPEWPQLRDTAGELLRLTGKGRAANLLLRHPFQCMEATNHFNDEFSVLHIDCPPAEYVKFAKYKADPEAKADFKDIAEAITELGSYIRFIGVRVTKLPAGPDPVKHPELATASDTLKQALFDAQILFEKSGPASAIDRMHTALHDYLRAVCDDGKITYTPDSNIPGLFGLIRREHPRFSVTVSHGEHLEPALKGTSAILEALGRTRNNASLAHAPKELLPGPEAMFMINVTRSVFHYLHSKLEEK
jgi:hypothetical protein